MRSCPAWPACAAPLTRDTTATGLSPPPNGTGDWKGGGGVSLGQGQGRKGVMGMGLRGGRAVRGGLRGGGWHASSIPLAGRISDRQHRTRVPPLPPAPGGCCGPPRLSTVKPTVGQGSVPPSQPALAHTRTPQKPSPLPWPPQNSGEAWERVLWHPGSPPQGGMGGGPGFPGGLRGGRSLETPIPREAPGLGGGTDPQGHPESAVGTSPGQGADPQG